jgi:hypothetical protein
MKYFLALVLLAMATAQVGSQPDPNLAGSWRVKFNMVGVENKNLVFEAKPKGAGTFLLLDTGLDNKPVPDGIPAVWSQLTNKRVSVSGNVELPIGNCCREIGTLIFNGSFVSDRLITGRAVFITSTRDEENFIGFRSTVGTFTASREP